MPRTARLPISGQNALQPDSRRLRPGASSSSQSATVTTDSLRDKSAKPRSRPTGIPQSTNRPPTLRSVGGSAPSTSSRYAETSDMMPQEVPLIMDTGQGLTRRNQTSTSTRIARPSDALSDTRASLDTDHDAIFGIVMPKASTVTRVNDLPPRLIPELRALAASSTRQQEAFNHSVSSISSPSTRLSSSTSPWSASTTATTPLSWSSASPAILKHVPVKAYNKRSQTVPLPSSKRAQVPRVPAVPEMLAVSGRNESAGSKELRRSPSKKRTPLSTPAPTPPPRISSAKQSLSRSSSKGDKMRSRPDHGRTPPLSDIERSPLSRRGQTDIGNIGASLRQDPLARAYGELQQSLDESAPKGHPQPVRPLRKTDLAVVDDNDIRFYGGPQYVSMEHVDLTRRERGFPPTESQPTVLGPPEPALHPSPSRLGKFSRLGIFGRKGKSPATDVERSPRKLQRKGPAAGTGHEGYTKYVTRGRKTSQESKSANNSESERSVSSTTRTPLFSTKGKDSRSSSRRNRSSQSDLDEFAATRMRPVPIIGGSVHSLRSNLESRNDGNDMALSPPVPNFQTWSTPSHSQTSVTQQTWDDSLALGSSISLPPRKPPTLALRRSQRFGNETEGFSLPTPIRTEQFPAPLYISSQDESRSSALAVSMSTPSTTTEFNRGDVVFNRPKDKKSRKLRWNIFRRKETETQPEQTARPPSSSPEEMSVRISSVLIPRPMPYYAMMDSESEMNTETGDFFAQVMESPSISPLAEEYGIGRAEDEQQPQGYDDEVFLPNAPLSSRYLFTRPPPSVPLRSPTEQAYGPVEKPRQRQPRLAQVGRIPPVVQRSERQHTPSRASFSQPFARNPVFENSHDLMVASESEQPIPLQISTDILPSRPFTPTDNVRIASAPALAESEFRRFPARKSSEISASSSSEGAENVLGPPLFPQMPSAGISTKGFHHPDTDILHSPSVDEVWNEYDDLIDDVMSPSRRKSARAPGLPDVPAREGTQVVNQAATLYRNALSIQPPTSDISPNSSTPILKRPVLGLSLLTSATPPVVFPSPEEYARTVGEDIRLRRSRIVSALHSSIDPASPFSIRDLLREYENLPTNSARLSERFSISTAGRSLERLTTTMSATEASSHQDNVALLDVVERSKNPAAQSELHYASLMVAKWLSFGRVLFSPAHDEIHTIAERRILVIDGLGNEDWSIYCAVTYEEQRALVYDLKEGTSTKVPTGRKLPQHPPGNHRRAEIPSFSERFPFPTAFFCAVVLRFPPAMAEAKMKNIVSECRRVLLPSGYLELMLLDLDIVNMGVQTRRAVRELKFKMTTADKQINLKPIIDHVQNVLGERGFHNISRCVVGVPVAGHPTGSNDSSSSSRSSGGSDGRQRRGSEEPRQANASPRMTFAQGRKNANLSLNDLIADHSENADKKIGKIVSRTARTWWQHCFEASVIPDGNLSRSIFANKNVLGECKGRGSSFKMLIAYAQRPVFETRRRTMSEPGISTTATAGAHGQGQSTSSGSRTA